MTVTGSAGGPPTSSIPAIHESWLPREHSLYRPRHGTQQVALVCALVFFFLPAAAVLLFGPSDPNQNHRPYAFPSLASGWDYFTQLSPWANDHLAFKSQAVDLTKFLSRDLFGEAPQFDRNVPAPQSGPVAPVPSPQTQPNDPGQDPDQHPTTGFPQVIEGRSGWLYLGFDTQGKCQPSQSLDIIVNNLSRLRKAVEQSGRRLVLVVAPDKSTMVPEHLPSSYGGKDCAAKVSTQFWNRLATEVGILDLRASLEAESVRLGRPVYFQQDTHWMFDGALTMTRAIAEKLQPGVTSSWKVTQGLPWKGPADLPTLIGSTGQNQATRYGLAPDGDQDRAHWFNTDFRVPLILQSYPTQGMVADKTAMIADSYTQFANGYLAATFSDISITHVEDLLKDSKGVADRLTQAHTVVVEVVERHLAAGVSPITNPDYLNTIVNTLAAHPYR